MKKRLVYAEDVMDNIDALLDEVGPIVLEKPYSYYSELMGCIHDAPTANINQEEE